MTTGYGYLTLWVNGGNAGGQDIALALVDANGNNLPQVSVNSYFGGQPPRANRWQQLRVPLADLAAVNQTITGIMVQDNRGGAQPTFYVDDVAFTP